MRFNRWKTRGRLSLLRLLLLLFVLKLSVRLASPILSAEPAESGPPSE